MANILEISNEDCNKLGTIQIQGYLALCVPMIAVFHGVLEIVSNHSNPAWLALLTITLIIATGFLLSKEVFNYFRHRYENILSSNGWKKGTEHPAIFKIKSI